MVLSDHGNILAISSYAFAPGELVSILSFLVASPTARGKIQHLSLHSCGISDGDCRSIAGEIKAYISLFS